MAKTETEGGENIFNDRHGNRHMMQSRTCEDEHLIVRNVRVAQHAWKPQDDHGVDEEDVAHVLIQVEVLQEEPGRQRRHGRCFR